jgi:hypothetical protein
MGDATAIRDELRVSVQAYEAVDLVSGHLAPGLLLDSDLVLVPAPPDEVWEPGADPMVVIIPVERRLEKAVERLPTRKITTIGLGDDRPGAALITLLGHSRYAAQVGHPDPAALRKALLEHDGDFPRAFEALGVLRPDQLQVPRDLLAEAGLRERRQRLPRRADHRYATVAALAEDVCNWPLAS